MMIGLGLGIALAPHVELGEDGVVALLARQGLGQGLNLLLGLVGFAGGRPKALLLENRIRMPLSLFF